MLLFDIKDTQDHEIAIQEIDLYLGALRQNGQILGKEIPLYYKENDESIVASCVSIPENISLNIEYANKYVSKSLNIFKKLSIGHTFEIMGKEVDSYKNCQCKSVEYYILYTHYLTVKPPLHCGNCFGIIPLYKIPKTYDDEYNDIISWESDYHACDRLQMNCKVGERFGLQQLNKYSSNLNKNGIEICKRIKNLTGKSVYYYLYRYLYSTTIVKEKKRKCPSCGNEWLLESKLFELFDFKCEKCTLLSNVSFGV